MKRLLRSLVLVVVVGCSHTATPECVPDSAQPAVSSAEVCAKLSAMRCVFDDDPMLGAADECAQAYAAVEVATVAADFARLTHCYAAATSCAQVAGCSLACAQPPRPDAGP